MYIVEVRKQWKARLTINSEVDKHYWMNGHFEEAGCLNGELAHSGWLLLEELPLSDASRAVELWDIAMRSGSGVWKERQAVVDCVGAIELLLACTREAKLEAENGQAARWKWRWQRRIHPVRTAEWDREGLLRLGVVWEREKRRSAAERYGEQKEGKSGIGVIGLSEKRTSLAGSYSELRERANAASWYGENEGRSRETYAMKGPMLSVSTLGLVAAWAELAADVLQGRALLRSEAHALLTGAGGPGAAASWSAVLQLAALLGRVRLGGSVAAEAGVRVDGLRRRRRECSCLRCGSGEAKLHRTACAACGRVCAYCTACIGMGRSRECELLVIGQRAAQLKRSAEQGGTKQAMQQISAEQSLGKWGLSPAQTAAAAKALRFVEGQAAESTQAGGRESAPKRDFLLWAVTGAGKTEMIFPLLGSVLQRGGRALIATPRRDVVIELDPRIRKAFPAASVVTLYGGSAQRWESGDITLATTHQLLRFYQGFDLVVIDELDAFPYAGDPMLHYAADKSCAPGAARLLLSATPPSELQRAAKRGKLPHARVPVRYHRHPLPVPKLLQIPAVQQMLQQRRLPSRLQAAMQKSLMRGAQLFVFVQRIAQTEPMAAMLRDVLMQGAVAATSSQDAERAEKVQRFRTREIRVLVTTTILERGVTIPKSDVYILDADGRLFDEASLVQMAGRAGRSADDPFGQVYFCSRERNHAQLSAVRHIQTMNRMARKHGYLLPAGKGGSST